MRLVSNYQQRAAQQQRLGDAFGGAAARSIADQFQLGSSHRSADRRLSGFDALDSRFSIRTAGGRCICDQRRAGAVSSSRRPWLVQFSRGLLNRSASFQSRRIKASRPKPKPYPVHQRPFQVSVAYASKHRTGENGTILYPRGNLHESQGAPQHEFG